MRTSALFDAKNFRCFEIYGVSARTRGIGLSQCGHFFGQGGGFNFSQFCADVLYGQPLIASLKSRGIQQKTITQLTNCPSSKLKCCASVGSLILETSPTSLL